MARAPFQVLGVVFCRLAQAPTSTDGIRIALFKRSTDETWQGLAGGGEDQETPSQALVREINEEAGLCPSLKHIYPLDSQVMVPRVYFDGHEAWPSTTYVIPMHSFAVEVSPTMKDDATPADSHTFTLSEEHLDAAWLSPEQAKKQCRYDSDRVAIWELEQRIQDGTLHSLADTAHS